MSPKLGKNVVNLMDRMADVAGKEVKATNSDLSQVAGLAKLQFETQLKVAQIEDELKAAKEELRRIAEEDLPTALKECGLKEFTTEDGLVVSVKPDINVGITNDRKPIAYAWLREHDFGGLIKADIELHFSKDEIKTADKVLLQLRKKGFNVDFSESVHPSTLKAFVKEQMADTEAYTADDPFPLELFGVRPYEVASVKPKKNARGK